MIQCGEQKACKKEQRGFCENNTGRNVCSCCQLSVLSTKRKREEESDTGVMSALITFHLRRQNGK